MLEESGTVRARIKASDSPEDLADERLFIVRELKLPPCKSLLVYHLASKVLVRRVKQPKQSRVLYHIELLFEILWWCFHLFWK